MRIFYWIGYVLDRLDLGGWILLLSGWAIVASTVLVPAWRSVCEMEYQTDELQIRLDLLSRQRENYEGFIEAYEDGDPLLMQRLAWHQLHVKPPEAELLSPAPLIDAPPDPINVDRWVQPLDVVPLPKPHRVDPLADAPFINSRLAELLTGPRRPYVLGLGGLLILLSLVLNPQPHVVSRSSDAAGDDEDEAFDDDAEYEDGDN